MKKIIFTVLMSFALVSLANDWEFSSEGGNLVPLEESAVAIKKEKITMTLMASGFMQVDVAFVFDSPVGETKKIGFIMPPDHVGELEIYNFNTQVNQQAVASKVSLFNKSPFKDSLKLPKQESLDEFDSYIYYFDANFKLGENSVEHSYIFRPSSGVDSRNYDYVITTINQWQNKKIDDFELVIDMGKNSYFLLPVTFWSNNKKIDWEIVGEGKQLQTQIKREFVNMVTDVVVVKIIDGHIRFKAKDFAPESDINIVAPSYHGFQLKNQKGYSFDYGLCNYKVLASQPDQFDASEYSEQDLRIIKNCSYALRGYDFTNAELKKYFSQFFWYDGITKNTQDVLPKTKDAIAVDAEIQEWLEQDLSKYSAQELRQMKNTPYALRGYPFKSKVLLKYFKNKYDWYVPVKYLEIEEIGLTTNEQQLINKIVSLKKKSK